MEFKRKLVLSLILYILYIFASYVDFRIFKFKMYNEVENIDFPTVLF